jgi:hypothetical protein
VKGMIMTNEEQIGIINDSKFGNVYYRMKACDYNWHIVDLNHQFNFQFNDYIRKHDPKKRLMRLVDLPISFAIKFENGVIQNCTSRNIPSQLLWFGGSDTAMTPQLLIERNIPWSSDLKTWHSFEVEEKE